MSYDLVIKNGTIVNSNGSFLGDIGVVDGKIAALKESISSESSQLLDATNRLVFPGIIDAHTHMEHGSGDDTTVDDFERGSKAAACGGVTTFMDFIIQRDKRSIEESFALRNTSAKRKAVIDYSFHIALMDVDERILEEIPQAIANISSSFKLFMTYRKLGFMVSDDMLLRVMAKAADQGGMIGVHGENDSIVEYLQEKHIKENKTSPIYHAESRPNIAEAEAINRAIAFSKITDCPLYIFHLTTKESLHLVGRAREEGLQVFAETNPHYLLLNKESYTRPDGQNFIMSPPLRSREDCEALWNGIYTGHISVLSTDHCPYHKQHKIGGREDFRKVSPGIPGIELLLPLTYSEGVAKGRISLEKMVDLLCYQPAATFGLTPAKGSISVGSHADLVLFDPEKRWSVDPKRLMMKSDYSPYEGFAITGRVEKTISRGRVVFDGQDIVAEPGFGQYLYR